MTPIPLSSVTTYQSPNQKDFNLIKNTFLWIGSSGMVHKGLDLVLEAFSEIPEYNLIVCGPVKTEKDFNDLYYKELYQTKNIRTIGWTNTSSLAFQQILNSCVAIIYPSCAEGQAGSVITCMQGGLIPIVSVQSGVDVEDFGIVLNECSVDEIKKTVIELAALPVETLNTKALATWNYARQNHSREKFAETYSLFVKNLIKEKAK